MEVIFATPFELRLAGPDLGDLELAAEATFAECRRIEGLTSVWLAGSALSRFNAAAARAGRHEVPEELARIVERSLTFCAESGDAFDPTVGALLTLYGYYRGGGDAPNPEAIAAVRKRVGGHVLGVDGDSIVTELDGVRLDLGGVAKGWAVDCMTEVLRAAGVKSALISGGGSVVMAIGDAPGVPGEKRGWPFEAFLGDHSETWWLLDEAVATSGQLSQPTFVGGKIASHLIDPRTGGPVDHLTLLSIVRASAATDADLASTALLVLGTERARARLASGSMPDAQEAWTVDVDPEDRSLRVGSRLR